MSNVPPAPWLMPPAARWMPLDQRNDNSSISSSILATALISLALVVAIVVFLHLYVRYVVRRQLPGGAGRRLTTIDLLRFHAATINIEETPHAASGLDPSAIAALPSFSYQKTTSGEEDEGNPAECAVCLSAVEEGEMVRLLPNCKHLFHVGCIDMWLASHMTCPVCRATVEPPPDTAADGGEASAPPQPQPPVLVRESSGATGTSQEGTSGAKEGDSVSSRLSASLKRMMSRERSSSSSRRAQGDATEDLERQ